MTEIRRPQTISHRWDLSPDQAVELQKRLAGRVIERDCFESLHRVAGVDVGFEDDGATTRAAICVLSLDTLEIIEQAVARQATRFPYIPGLLSFREIPAILAALERLDRCPDLLMCDGQGRAHPRHLGIASHLGLITDLPSIGVGKSRLCGRHGPVPESKGAWTELYYYGEVVGAVLRSREKVKPVYVSCGHKISLPTAIDLVIRCLTRYKLPEPTRLADKLASSK